MWLSAFSYTLSLGKVPFSLWWWRKCLPPLYWKRTPGSVRSDFWLGLFLGSLTLPAGSDCRGPSNLSWSSLSREHHGRLSEQNQTCLPTSQEAILELYYVPKEGSLKWRVCSAVPAPCILLSRGHNRSLTRTTLLFKGGGSLLCLAFVCCNQVCLCLQQWPFKHIHLDFKRRRRCRMIKATNQNEWNPRSSFRPDQP